MPCNSWPGAFWPKGWAGFPHPPVTNQAQVENPPGRIYSGCMKLILLVLCLSFWTWGDLAAQTDSRPLDIHPHPVLTPLRQELNRQYLKHHAGLDTHKLTDPQMIVIHDTETATLAQAFAYFDHDRLDGQRPDIVSGGEVNVGIHYIIDTDGTIWSLFPEDEAARHTIGFNHTALGIEMIAPGPRHLTMAQLEACTALVADMVRRNPSVKYLVGHFEYMNSKLPHFALRRELDPAYGPTFKTDPGPVFMEALRSRLNQNFGISLEP